MVLVQVLHTIEAVTATVPLSMIMLLDHIKRKTVPTEMRIRMIFPTNGLQSASFWDVDDPEELQKWLDEYVGDDCENIISEVQEDFAWGISAPLSTARGAEIVTSKAGAAARSVSKQAQEITKNAAGAASSKLGQLDEKYHITSQASKTYSAAKEKTVQVAGATGHAIGSIKDRAMQNESVAKTVNSVGNVTGAALRSVGKGIGFLSSKFGEISATVAQSVQEYNSAENLQGVDSASKAQPEEPGGPDAPMEPKVEPQAKEPAFSGFDEDAEEAPLPPGPAPALPVSSSSPKEATRAAAAAAPASAYTLEDELGDLEAEAQADAQELPGLSELEAALGAEEVALGLKNPSPGKKAQA